MNKEDIEHLQSLIKEYKKRLNVLEIQAARFGINCPPHVINEIEEIKDRVEKFEIQLKNNIGIAFYKSRDSIGRLNRELEGIEIELKGIVIKEEKTYRFLGIPILTISVVARIIQTIFIIICISSLLLFVGSATGLWELPDLKFVRPTQVPTPTVIIPTPTVVVRSGKMTPEEILQARQAISEESNELVQGDKFETLQAGVIYASQRDNQALNPDGSRIESRSGNMGQLTSLAMAMNYIGISNPNPNIQYEDSLEQIRQERGFIGLNNVKSLSGVAEALGARVYLITYTNVLKRQWFMQNVRPALRQGHGVILTLTGSNNHIVRLQGINAQGLIVDDPYGRCKLLVRDQYSYSQVNKYDATNQNAGEDVLWPWEDVEQHNFGWAMVIMPSSPAK